MSQYPRFHPLALRPLACLALALVAAAAIGQPKQTESPADPDAPEVTACLEAVEQDFRTKRPSADDIVFAVETIRAWQETKDETGIRGQGWYLGGQGNWKDISYTCIYDVPATEITAAQVDFQDPVAEADAEAPPRYKADPNAPASRSCLEAIESQINDDRPRLQELDFDRDLLREWQESEGETGISGVGEYVGGAGNRKSFIFSCIFNEQKEKATTARYRVKS
ncbi:MAG: hypothetical protein WBH85_10880 [Thermoanaerobaculia bacterium]